MRKEGIYRRKKRILQFDPYSPAMHVAIDEKRAEVYAALGRFALHWTTLVTSHNVRILQTRTKERKINKQI